MAIYECNKCGMSVKTSCAKCDEDLIDDVLNLIMVQKFKFQNVQIIMEK